MVHALNYVKNTPNLALKIKQTRDAFCCYFCKKSLCFICFVYQMCCSCFPKRCFAIQFV